MPANLEVLEEVQVRDGYCVCVCDSTPADGFSCVRQQHSVCLECCFSLVLLRNVMIAQ